MRKFVLVSIVATMGLSGCLSAVGVGETTRGEPITGKYEQKPLSGGMFNLDVQISTSRAGFCSGNQNLKGGQGIWRMPLKCESGATGSMTLTADYINYRDTLIYKLSNGERGKLTFGSSLHVDS